MHLELTLIYSFSIPTPLPTPSLLHPYSIPTPSLLHPYSTPTPPLLHPYSTLLHHPPPPYSTLLHPTPPYSTTLLHHPTPPYSTLLHPTPPYSIPTPSLLHPHSISILSLLHLCLDLLCCVSEELKRYLSLHTSEVVSTAEFGGICFEAFFL